MSVSNLQPGDSVILDYTDPFRSLVVQGTLVEIIPQGTRISHHNYPDVLEGIPRPFTLAYDIIVLKQSDGPLFWGSRPAILKEVH
jgi:hypothetical protein